MRLSIIAVFVLILFFGCTSVQEQQDNTTNQPICKSIIKQQTVTRMDCQNISKTSTICDERLMNYSTLSLTKSNICTAGACAGYALYDCMDCSAAMTRCILTVKSGESVVTGTIEMEAEFTFPSGSFIKNPVSKTIKPGQNATFDFYQSYSLSTQFSTPECDIYLTEDPLVEECTDVTTYESICTPVTVTEPVETIVCS